MAKKKNPKSNPPKSNPKRRRRRRAMRRNPTNPTRRRRRATTKVVRRRSRVGRRNPIGNVLISIAIVAGTAVGGAYLDDWMATKGAEKMAAAGADPTKPHFLTDARKRGGILAGVGILAAIGIDALTKGKGFGAYAASVGAGLVGAGISTLTHDVIRRSRENQQPAGGPPPGGAWVANQLPNNQAGWLEDQRQAQVHGSPAAAFAAGYR